MILLDTGPLVAAALHGDTNHVRCVEFFTAAHLNAEPLLVPSLVVTEVCYLLAREAGARIEAEFLRSLAAGDFQLIEPTSTDLDRAADLVTTYADFPLGAVDATVVAVAERLTSPKSPPSTTVTSPPSAPATQTPSSSGPSSSTPTTRCSRRGSPSLTAPSQPRSR